MVAETQRRLDNELETINRIRRETEEQKQVVLRQQADNWAETDRLRAERNNFQQDLSIIQRDKQLLMKRDLELKNREDQRRRNRHVYDTLHYRFSFDLKSLDYAELFLRHS